MAPTDSDEGTLLENVLADYYEAVERGEMPLRETLATLHPHLAPALEEFFANEERFDKLAAPLRAAPVLPHVPGYEVLCEAGRGGMGVVYKARHIGLDRLVALKMLPHGARPDPLDLTRLRAEAATVARLQHPHIVQVFEVGECDGRPYLAMEFIDGVSLAARLAGDPQPPTAAARLVAALADAMQHAHERGVIHRDLKPGNVLLQKPVATEDTEDTERSKEKTSLGSTSSVAASVPKITDFGLAKRCAATTLTGAGQILGTPSYMAPEQAAGHSRDCGPAADVWALGAILYECLTGGAPFRGVTNLETLYQVVHRDPVPPRQLQPGVPLDLETVCLKCLQKDPGKRYASARALAEDLNRFGAGEPVRARPPGPLERTVRWARRKPWAAAFGALVALMASAGLVLPPVVALQIRNERNEARREADENARQLKETTDRLDFEARASAARGHLLAGRQCLDAGDSRQAEEHATEALALVNRDARLDGLRAEALAVRDRGRARLNDQAARQQALDTWKRFQALLDDVRYHVSQFTSLDVAENVAAARAAAAAALALYDVTLNNTGAPAVGRFPDRQRPGVESDCLEVLLLWAEAEGQLVARRPPPQRPEAARRALQVLARAETLGVALPHAFHRRRAYFLRLADDPDGAARAEARSREVAPAGALDAFVLGLEAFAANKVPEAIAAFEDALRARPDHFGAHYHLAVCYLRLPAVTPEQGVVNRLTARASLTAGLTQKPEATFLYIIRGFVNAEFKDFRAASADFARAGELLDKAGGQAEPSLRYALLHNRGNAELRKGDLDAALASLEKAVGLHPRPWKAHASLAQVHEARQDYAAAVADLDRALAIQPHETALYRQRAAVHELRGDDKAALADLDRAIARMKPSPTSPLLAADHLQRGSILLRAGNHAEALAALDAAAAIRPDHADTYRLRAEALALLGRRAEALRAFNRYFELGGRPTAEVYCARGRLRALAHDLPGALDDYTRALDLQPDHTTALQRGWVLLLTDAPRLALRDFEGVLKVKQAGGAAHAGRANARAVLGLTEDALADADEAVRLSPQDAAVLAQAARAYALAAAHTQAVEPAERCQDRAVALLRQALQTLPEDRRAAFWRDLMQNDAGYNSLRRYRPFVDLGRGFTQTSG